MPPLLNVPALPLTLKISVSPGTSLSSVQLLEFANRSDDTLKMSTPPLPLPVTVTPLHSRPTAPVASSCDSAPATLV